MKRFEGKTALVTGAASGIGRATVVRLTEEGARVVGLDVNASGLAETEKEVRDAGGTTLVLEGDVSSEASVKANVARAVEHLGKLDVLCNVAGILRADHTHELSLEAFNRILAVNLAGTFLMSRECIPHLLETKGNIVNMSSTAALGSHPWMAAYAASKGGILAMTRSMSVEYVKQGLRVNAVCPGGVTTPLHGQFSMPEGADAELLKGAIPFVKYADPSEIAAAVAFIASHEAKYMNGAELRLDGGAMS